jgi:hypothetical protein
VIHIMNRSGRYTKFRVKEINFREEDIVFRLPFKFGSVTLTAVPQLLVDLAIELEDGTISRGVSAETLAPKWFDKNPLLTNQENYQQLRNAVGIAADLYRSAAAETAFGLYISCYSDQMSRCLGQGLNPLVASFGQAILDRAILDALCKIHGVSFYKAIQVNLPGIQGASILPELTDFKFDSFLASLKPADSICVRHTVGLVDPIVSSDLKNSEQLNDGLPQTLEEVIQIYGNRYFKIKISGDVEADISRLAKITGVLTAGCPGFYSTLDGNEQYRSPEHFREFWGRMKENPELNPLINSILFIEQPIHRDFALDLSVADISEEIPVIIDESGCDLDAFPRARGFGYRGVSSKQCKGLYKSFINKARCLKWNRQVGFDKFILSGEDLTTQAGIAVQQDLALASILGLTHLERNGHHYVKGMSGKPRQEQEEYLRKYPGLYIRDKNYVRLDIREGRLNINSLDCPGFAS